MLLLRRLLGKFKFRRTQNINVARSRLFHNVQEVKIEVPWGHIAGRLWNQNSKAIPFLCIHGWKESAASFDKIVPMILSKCDNDKYQFLCIDLPGHGFSSPYPPGMLYQMLDVMVIIRRVVHHYGWLDKRGIHLMGHGLGGILGFIFTASHPEVVDCLITIDGLVPVQFSKDEAVNMIAHISKSFLDLEKSKSIKNNMKTYEKREIMKILLDSHTLGIHKLACEVLLTRAVLEHPPNSGKYTFAHDPRIHFLPLMSFSPEQIELLAKRFKSKLLHIKAENGVNYISDYMQANIEQWLAEDNKKSIRITIAKKAPHHVHLVEPEKIVPDILQFLSSSN